jgi:hypothetical protein
MIDYLKGIILSQFQAGLGMLDDCLRRCPDDKWDGPIGKYPFWHVAYHTLCYVDLYLSPGEAAYTHRPDIHPAGMNEFSEEYPSRRFTREELIGYLDICRRKADDMLAADTPASLQAGSGFPWLPFSRGELHIYNLRHVQHHTGQLSAYLRRAGVETKWIKNGCQPPAVSRRQLPADSRKLTADGHIQYLFTTAARTKLGFCS